ncbi:UNVERIFIED_CONTAM: hypothetical protein FKN15_072424 [Acipenser sinensis]
MVASCFQIFVGFSGLIGLFMRFIGHLTIAPTSSLIGLSLFDSSGNDAGKHWGISALTVSIIVLFSQYLRHIPAPMPAYNKTKKFHSTKIYVFQILPVLAGMTVSWLICYILTEYKVLPSDPEAYGYWARTDLKGDVLGQAPWFRFPHPGQWGMPTVSPAGVFGILAGVISFMIESVGDYHACAPPPPKHAINRGVGIEGIGCLMAGAWGTGNGTPSPQAMGPPPTVGSRMVIVTSGFLMICMGMFGKVAAIFTTIPTPVIGGVTELDQVLRVLLTTSMFVGGFFGFVLDNTIPGSRKERGIVVWKEAHQQSGETLESEEVYSLPFGIGSRICTASWVRYIPFCPKPAGTDSGNVGNNEDTILEKTDQALPNGDTQL